MNIQLKLRKFKESVHVRGFWRTCRSIVQAFIFDYRRVYLFYRLLSNEGRLNPHYTYRLATIDDVDSLRTFQSMYTPLQFHQLITGGDYVFIACDDGIPIAFQIASFKSGTRLPRSKFPLTEKQVWILDTYTLREHRQHHVAASLKTFRDRYFLQRGVYEIVATVMENNFPSLFYVTSSPIRSVQFFMFFRFLGFSLFRLNTNATDQLHQHLQQYAMSDKRKGQSQDVSTHELVRLRKP